MRLAVWNCNMALHDKAECLQRLDADLLILPECARPEVLAKHNKINGYEIDWVGQNQHKGLAVLVRAPWAVKVIDRDSSIEWVLPLEVTGPLTFHLLALWAHYKGGQKSIYRGPARDAVTHYADFLQAAPSVVAGDLNNHVRWDKPGYEMNHTQLISDLATYNLVSAYHSFHGVAQGAEVLIQPFICIAMWTSPTTLTTALCQQLGLLRSAM